MDIQKLRVKMKVKKPDGAILIFKPRVQVWVALQGLHFQFCETGKTSKTSDFDFLTC